MAARSFFIAFDRGGMGLRISDHLFRFEDSSEVYVLVNGTDAICIDFGTGAVLDHLTDFGPAGLDGDTR
jgi:hypothetical protein